MDKKEKIVVNNITYYLQKIDSTHFYLSLFPDRKGEPYHVGQFYDKNGDHTFYNDVNKWLDGKKSVDGETYAGFYKYGGIINQYLDKTASEVWNLWTDVQRKHFITDHMSKILHEKDIEAFWNHYKEDFDKLPERAKEEVERHVKDGQYAKGGETTTVYDSHDAFILQVFVDDKQIDKQIIRANDKQAAREIAEDTYEPKFRKQYGSDVRFELIKGYDKGGTIDNSVVKENKVGERKETFKAKVSKNMTFCVYEYKDGGFVVAVKFANYPQQFVQHIFPSYGLAIVDAEGRAGIYKSGGEIHADKFGKVMSEFKHGNLEDSHGNKVTSRGQALAIAYSQTRHEEKKMEAGGGITKPRAVIKFTRSDYENLLSEKQIPHHKGNDKLNYRFFVKRKLNRNKEYFQIFDMKTEKLEAAWYPDKEELEIYDGSSIEDIALDSPHVLKGYKKIVSSKVNKYKKS